MTEDCWMDNELFDELELEFDNYWMDICEYAEELGYSPRYIEEEFCIDGILEKVNPPPQE